MDSIVTFIAYSVVLLLVSRLVHRAVIIYGHQLDVGHAQSLNVVKAGGNACGIGGAFFDQAQIFSLVLNAGAFVHTQVTDMQLIDHRIGDGFTSMGVTVLRPSLRKVDGHRQKK